ncbi:MAG: NAD(P)H-dependent oxidoreductase [Candidatus Azobacteroides sp.]|nr:NAD(P)H-dependent oxidoreductase [Candidatus Azobacteroides sp.]
MKYLIVYANPNPGSLCQSIANTLKETLTEQNKEVILRNLYDENFNAVLDLADLNSFTRRDYFIDIKEEHAYILDASTLIFVYPIWWMGPPAIMKGYFDRVFSSGFAYTVDNNRLEKGLKGKRVAVINTMGMSNEYYESQGITEAMKKLLTLGLFEYTGLEVIDHKFYGGIYNSDETERMKILEDVKTFAQGLSHLGVDTKTPVW